MDKEYLEKLKLMISYEIGKEPDGNKTLKIGRDVIKKYVEKLRESD